MEIKPRTDNYWSCRGHRHMKAVLVGEAWGRREAQFQHALVGPSGRELTLELGISGFAPHMIVRCRRCKRETEFRDSHCEHCAEYIWPNEFDLIAHWKRLRDLGIAVTNVFNTQPPGNDLGFFFGYEPETEMPGWKASQKSGGSHLRAEHFHHLKRLWHELDDLQPNLVVCMGNAACWAVLGQTKISVLRGTVAMSPRLGLKVLPTFHPAAVLRNMPLRVSTIADWQKAAREAETPTITRPKRYILQVDPDAEGLRCGDAWLREPALAYAVDIETYGGLITMVGFAHTRDDIVVFPFRGLDGNYWPDPNLEFEAWKIVQRGLLSPVPKIFQNGLYDISYFMRMGLQVRNAQHDTMLWHHSEYPELPKSLGYLGSIYASEVAWKQIPTKGNLKRDE
jgi:uracil-DNA glycosylase